MIIIDEIKNKNENFESYSGMSPWLPPTMCSRVDGENCGNESASNEGRLARPSGRVGNSSPGKLAKNAGGAAGDSDSVPVPPGDEGALAWDGATDGCAELPESLSKQRACQSFSASKQSQSNPSTLCLRALLVSKRFLIMPGFVHMGQSKGASSAPVCGTHDRHNDPPQPEQR